MILITFFTLIFSLIGFHKNSFMSKFIFDISLIKSEPFRIITYAFIHFDYYHLILNLIIAHYFGSKIQQTKGVEMLIIIYFTSIIIGAFAVLLTYKNYRVCGNSGAMFALIFYNLPTLDYIELILILVIIIISFLNKKVSHITHFGGIITAVLFLLI